MSVHDMNICIALASVKYTSHHHRLSSRMRQLRSEIVAQKSFAAIISAEERSQ